MNTMPIPELFALALRALRRNGLRSALTLAGITIGVGAVLTMVALGHGARMSIQEQVTAAGMNVVTVTAGNYRMKQEGGGDIGADHASLWDVVRPRFRLIGHPEDDPMETHNHPTARQRLGDTAAGLGAAATLTRDDADAIRREIRSVRHVAGAVHESARVVLNDRRWFTRLHGTEAAIADIRRAWSLRHGRFFGEREGRRGAQVIVLGSVVHEKLFGANVNPVGATVTIWNQPFEVIGVIAGTSWTSTGAAGDDEFDAVYVPLTTVHRLLNLSRLNTITLTSRSVGGTTRVARDVTNLLRVRHGIADASPDDFVVRTQASAALGKGMSQAVARSITGNVPGLEQVTLEQFSATLDRSSRTMTALLASVASVSLLVGGIGIMNIMLLSVTERTREIGLRMAVGARARDVLLQFLVEAMTLSLVGGLIGVAASLVASGGIRQLLRWSARVPFPAIVATLAVAAAVGLVFGLYPARRASRLEPIDALRFE